MSRVEQIQPADTAGYGGNGREPAGDAREKPRRPRRGRRVAQALSLLVAGFWIGFGIHGLVSYGHAYYKYRGFDPPRDARGVAHGRTITVRFRSRALDSPRSFQVYLPPGYRRDAASGRRFPVLYLLHGSPGSPSLFRNAGDVGVDVDRLVARHVIKPFLTVLPDGRDGTFKSDTEWANTPHGRYESFVLDVVRQVDARFPTRKNRRGRAIAGLSEGGYGAMNIALHHLGVFATVESWSGYFRQERTGVFRHVSAAELASNSPASYVASMPTRLRRRTLHALIYSGLRDPLANGADEFALQLHSAGGDVKFEFVPGRHDWALWRRMMRESLRFAAQWLGAAR